jgi:sugar phosphate isomerase/epimerase
MYCREPIIMKIFYSELCLIGGEVGNNVDRLIEHGAENVELLLDGAGWNDFHVRSKSIISNLRNKGVRYSVHVPVWDANLTSQNSLIRAAVMESYRQSIAVAAMLDATHVVLHPGFCPDQHFDKAIARERARESILSLLRFNESYGRLLLVENVGTPASSIFDQAGYSSFLDDFPSGVGYLVDIGHAFINEWDLGSLLPALGGRLFALHLHDNDGTTDGHAPLGQGNIDWGMVFATTKATGRDPSMILEYNIGIDPAALADGKALLESSYRGGVAPGKAQRQIRRLEPRAAEKISDELSRMIADPDPRMR